jgi:hypothetical protein
VNISDFDGAFQVKSDDELLTHLRLVRRDADGAFILDHGREESLWVHINGEVAFLWFCPDTDGKHPGYVPDGMWSGDHGEDRFLLVGGTEADSIWPVWHQLVTIEASYQAVIEFLHSPSLPPSVSWFEL